MASLTIDKNPSKKLPGWLHKEDSWAIIISFLLISVAYIYFINGGSIKWIASAPAKWTTLAQAGNDLVQRIPSLIGIYLLWATLLTISVKIIGFSAHKFLAGFTFLFVISVFTFQLGAWQYASIYSLEAPLLALLFGLIISNFFKIPAWLAESLRVEYFVKIGIILLGATLPLTLIKWAGPVALVQAAIVSLVTFFTIYFASKFLGLDRRFGAILGVGGAVCGVSAAIAVSGAVRGKREHTSVAISIIVIWAIITIFLLPLFARLLNLPTGVAGAWIGTSEFADAAGYAAAQTYSDFAAASNGAIAGRPEAAIQAFTLMKVIGRDIWIGIWSFALAFVAITFWNKKESVQANVGIGEVFNRFPKFILGFVVASIFITWLSSQYGQTEYQDVIKPGFVAPLLSLRTWAFIFCFFSIGLSTRFSSLVATGSKPLIAFTIGVVVNIIVGYFLSVHVFADFWQQLGN